MGSKKKKEASESSSSSSSSGSESESSSSSEEKRSKRKSRKESLSDSENTKKSPKKAKTEHKLKKKESPPPEIETEEAHSHKNRTERRSSQGDHDFDREPKKGRRGDPSVDPRERKFRDDRRMRNYGRYDDRRGRNNDYNNRFYEDRYRNRRGDYRNNQNRPDRRDDRERDYRNHRDDNRNYSNRDSYRSNNNRDNHQRRRSRSASFDHSGAKWGKEDPSDATKQEKKDPKEKQKPNFGLSGKLTEETNTYRGVVIKYSEPPEARKPKRRWRLYPFKGEKALQTLYIHRESAYLIGRDRKVVDLPVDHPSCSKQHAALQYRLVPFTREDGTTGKRVRPYLIDLNSANGTYINNKRIEASKYVELLEKDVIKFGYSSREYVLLHENSKDEAQDDDVKQEDEVQRTSEVEVKKEEEG